MVHRFTCKIEDGIAVLYIFFQEKKTQIKKRQQQSTFCVTCVTFRSSLYKVNFFRHFTEKQINNDENNARNLTLQNGKTSNKVKKK